MLKHVWTALIALFLTWFFYEKWDLISCAFQKVSIEGVAWATAYLGAAKLLLTVSMFLSVQTAGEKMSLAQCYAVYNKSQLYKYIPGNIWHFVSKAGYLNRLGFSANTIRDILIIENAMLLGSAAFIGFVSFKLTMPILLHEIIKQNLTALCLAGIGFALLCAFFLIRIGGRRLLNIAWQRRKVLLCNIVVLGLIWVGLGLSFHLLLKDFVHASSGSSAIGTIGGYAVAYCIGYATPFASAGLGVREGVLALAMKGTLSWESIVLASLLSRAIYIVVEIILFASCGRASLAIHKE